MANPPSPTTTYVTINPTVLTTTTVYSSTWTGRSTRRAKRAGELEIRAPTPAPVPDSEGIILPRQNAGNVPSYASACRPRSQFSTACSCLGVTAGPTVTIGPSVSIKVPNLQYRACLDSSQHACARGPSPTDPLTRRIICR